VERFVHMKSHLLGPEANEGHSELSASHLVAELKPEKTNLCRFVYLFIFTCMCVNSVCVRAVGN
jgi:hypothetical protein